MLNSFFVLNSTSVLVRFLESRCLETPEAVLPIIMKRVIEQRGSAIEIRRWMEHLVFQYAFKNNVRFMNFVKFKGRLKNVWLFVV